MSGAVVLCAMDASSFDRPEVWSCSLLSEGWHESHFRHS